MFNKVKLSRMLVSWSNIIEEGISHGRLVNTVQGALRTYDLPDLARTLGNKLTITDSQTAKGEPAEVK